MSDLSGSDMDVESGEQGSVPSSSSAAASSTTVAPIANEDAASSTAIDLRCENCHMPYDGTEKAPQAGDCGHIQCGSCWEKTNCNKCCQETSPHDVYMSPRDLMSPEPEAQLPPDGGNDFRKQEGCTTASPQTLSARIAAAQTLALGAASSLTSGRKEPATAPQSLSAKIAAAQTWVASSLTSLASQTSSKTPAPSNISNINVKCINGTQVNAKVDTSRTTVHEMKREVHRQSGISTERQHLLYKGKTMSDTRTLKSYEVGNGATLQMGTKCYGG